MQSNSFAIRTEYVDVYGKLVATGQESYIQNMDEWSEDFVVAQAQKEGLALTHEHRDVIHFIRDYYKEHNVQAQMRDMIKYFKQAWGTEHGNNHYLHDLFPTGPQKHDNHLSGVLHTKGKH